MSATTKALAKLGDAPSGKTMPVEAVELMAALVERNAHDLHFVTDQLMESYKNQAETAEATVQAIRHRVVQLLSGPSMPSAHVLEDALYPSDKVVNGFRKVKGL